MRRPIVLLVLGLAGCAPMTENQCRAVSDWYQQGFADAMNGNRPKVELYASQCGNFGVKPAETAYMDGWRIGYSEWNQRISGSRI